MADASKTLQWVVNQNSPDNQIRQDAEWQFSQAARENPSQMCFQLMVAAEDHSVVEHVRQSCLLHLRRMVPLFWSLGFSLFVGPPVDQALKSVVREKVLALATSSALSKIRSGSAYVIAQIAAVDYPDEWPSLLSDLYEQAVQFHDHVAVMGSLAVLNHLFDDLIGEDQFWDGGVGNELISYITQMLRSDLAPELKTSGLKLYLSVFNTLLSAETLGLAPRRALVLSHIVYISELLLLLLKELPHALEAPLLHLKSLVYQVFSRLLSNFSKHVPPAVKQDLLVAMAHDLIHSSAFFTDSCVSNGRELLAPDPLLSKSVTLHLCDLFDTLALLHHHVPISKSLPSDLFLPWVSSLVSCCVYPSESVEDYDANFNAFVTEVTGLASSATIRDSAHDLLADLSLPDASSVFDALKDAVYDDMHWSLAEARLFVLEGLCLNEDADIAGSAFLPLSFLSQLSALKDTSFPNCLVSARIILFLPRFMEKFSLRVLVNTFGVAQFNECFDLAFELPNVEENELIKAAALVSATSWNNVPGFHLNRLGVDTQRKIIDVAYLLIENSEEDTLPVLLEAISVAIDIDRNGLLHALVQDKYSVVEIIMLVSFKDPANVQLTIDSAECLLTMLADVLPEQYVLVCNKCVPYLLDVIKSNSVTNSLVEYSAALFLALELLGNVIGAAPQTSASQDALPQELFLYAFPVLKNLIMSTSDDQILQSAGEVFNNFLQTGSRWLIEYTDPESHDKGLDILLHISSKFLAPELSDSAAMNCGLIVMTLFEKFQAVLDQNFFYQLLQAAVKRLVLAKEVITIENLVMVFCKLVLNTSPEMVVDALTGIMIDTEQGRRDGLTLVMPIWFNSFEVTRGYEKIKQNILALGKIFSLGDGRVAELTVDGEPIPYEGDKIITRSMSKTMPQKYTQIKAPHKILKLLVSELEFQCLQPDPEDFESGEAGNGGDDDAWEDMGDIGVPTFDKLQSYVDSDDDEGGQVCDEGIKEMVIQFFKECISKNLGGFQSYYDLLSDEEKTIISENVIFD